MKRRQYLQKLGGSAVLAFPFSANEPNEDSEEGRSFDIDASNPRDSETKRNEERSVARITRTRKPDRFFVDITAPYEIVRDASVFHIETDDYSSSHILASHEPDGEKSDLYSFTLSNEWGRLDSNPTIQFEEWNDGEQIPIETVGLWDVIDRSPAAFLYLGNGSSTLEYIGSGESITVQGPRQKFDFENVEHQTFYLDTENPLEVSVEADGNTVGTQALPKSKAKRYFED